MTERACLNTEKNNMLRANNPTVIFLKCENERIGTTVYVFFVFSDISCPTKLLILCLYERVVCFVSTGREENKVDILNEKKGPMTTLYALFYLYGWKYERTTLTISVEGERQSLMQGVGGGRVEKKEEYPSCFSVYRKKDETT